MGVERRRTGFRLPWAGEAGEPEGEQSEADSKVDEMTAADGSAVPASETTSGDAPEGSTQGTAESSTAATTQDASGAPTTASETMATESDSADFLANLVGAMRGVAESSREASLSELRTSIEARVDLLGAEGTEQEAELRRRADVDLEGVGEWEHAEIERIRAEAETKREARRRELEQQLAERRTATDRKIEATRSRMADHERDLAAFFAQLGEITDPAAFVSAAKRMPRPPDLDAGTATPPAVESDERLSALALPTAAAPAQPAEVQPASPGADETAAPAVEPAAEPVADPASKAEPATDTASVPETSTPVTQAAAAESHLAARLAQLDERLSGATQTVAAAAPAANGGEQSTAIVVKGLGSFGAITSFKQALERVEGVRGVTLSLGPTGEFVYRASHAGDFDIRGAIQSIEGPTASIEETDGTLVVTLSRTR